MVVMLKTNSASFENNLSGSHRNTLIRYFCEDMISLLQSPHIVGNSSRCDILIFIPKPGGKEPF